MTQSPATMPIPVQLSEPEFIAFIFPHLSMPRRGRKCKLGYHRVFNLILWVLYTGMQWKCLPVPRAGDGTALIHYTTIYRVFARWCDDGSLERAFIVNAGQNPQLFADVRSDGGVWLRRLGLSR
jgi:transposase